MALGSLKTPNDRTPYPHQFLTGRQLSTVEKSSVTMGEDRRRVEEQLEERARTRTLAGFDLGRRRGRQGGAKRVCRASSGLVRV